MNIRPLRVPDGLLEYLAEASGCTYISDLTLPSRWFSVSRALDGASASSYRLSEWNDAIAYLTGRNVAFTDAVVARKYLMLFLYRA